MRPALSMNSKDWRFDSTTCIPLACLSASISNLDRSSDYDYGFGLTRKNHHIHLDRSERRTSGEKRKCNWLLLILHSLVTRFRMQVSINEYCLQAASCRIALLVPTYFHQFCASTVSCPGLVPCMVGRSPSKQSAHCFNIGVLRDIGYQYSDTLG